LGIYVAAIEEAVATATKIPLPYAAILQLAEIGISLCTQVIPSGEVSTLGVPISGSTNNPLPKAIEIVELLGIDLCTQVIPSVEVAITPFRKVVATNTPLPYSIYCQDAAGATIVLRVQVIPSGEVADSDVLLPTVTKVPLPHFTVTQEETIGRVL
jgi:hypothetical protein